MKTDSGVTGKHISKLIQAKFPQSASATENLELHAPTSLLMAKKRSESLRNAKLPELQLGKNGNELEEMKAAVVEFSRTFLYRDKRTLESRKVILTGPYGVGKTHVMRRLLNWATTVDWEALAVNWSYTPCIRWRSFSDYVVDVDRRDAAARSDMLFVDDLGAETDRYKTGEGNEALRMLLDKRQDRGWTMMSTNVKPALWSTRWDGRVKDRMFRGWTVVSLWNTPSWNLQ